MKEEKALIYKIRNIHFDEESSNLYKILSNYTFNKNIILENILNVLEKVENGNNKMENLIKELETSNKNNNYLVKIIFDYLYNNNLLITEDEECKLTYEGKLVILTDKITNTVDMIRYYWNKITWNEMYPEIKSSPFLAKESRRYLACLVSQIDLVPIDINTIKERYQNIDSSYFENININESLFNDKYVNFLLHNIFCPMGLLSYKIVNNKNDIKITDAGRKVFEYYSFNMIEEYKIMIDESWEYFDKGNFEQAYDIAKSAIGVIGNVPEIYNIIGCIKIKEKKFDVARDTFMLALELCEENIAKKCTDKKNLMDTYIIIYYNLGLCYYYQGDYIKAMHIFRNIKKTTPYYLDSIDNVIKSVKMNLIV